ncbi:hypothetical protein NBRC116586_33500 [Pseudooceanicola nitratireducens]|uniref:cupin domain-containing protein n=1 Tax=Pseudooceanicola nitratireducens TaxID=517719 RepID=UPI00310B5714
MMTQTPAHVIAFDDPETPCTTSVIDDPALVTEPYTSHAWRHFTNPGKSATAGIWEAGPHCQRESADYDEMCHILDGQVRLTDEDGTERVFGPGDSFTITRGFRGTWENLTHVRKVYFILG